MNDYISQEETLHTHNVKKAFKWADKMQKAGWTIESHERTTGMHIGDRDEVKIYATRLKEFK